MNRRELFAAGVGAAALSGAPTLGEARSCGEIDHSLSIGDALNPPGVR
ncbi:MAG: hypothetical protein JOZ27_03570, partial [Caulobacteraceae bacterium]|nr:hypothetical protein [Caulobacteraceae bacterium]